MKTLTRSDLAKCMGFLIAALGAAPTLAAPAPLSDSAIRAAQAACSGTIVVNQGKDGAAAETLCIQTVLDEGTETHLTPDQVTELKPWLVRTNVSLTSLLKDTWGMHPREANQHLWEGITDITLTSAPKHNETLTHYVLNRARKIVEDLRTNADPRSSGTIDLQNKVMRKSVEFAKRYYESDVAFVNGTPVAAGIVMLPFAEFGLAYSKMVMEIDASIFNAASQYNIALFSLQMLQSDLARDQIKNKAYGPFINILFNAIEKDLPSAATQDDVQNQSNVQRVIKIYQNVVDQIRAFETPVPPPAPAPAPHAQDMDGPTLVPYPYTEQPDGASHNYKGIYWNTDGSISIVEPGYLAGDGTTRPISGVDGSSAGICKLYGFSDYVGNSIVQGAKAESVVRISAYGKFLGYGWEASIKSIICTGADQSHRPKMQSYTKSVRTDDGSTAIIKPFFLGSDGLSRPISGADGSSEGICKMYGFTSYVPNSLIQGSSSQSVVRIGVYGHFIGYAWEAATESLICR